MHHVWELRVHPSQRFTAAWLEAVDRWALNMASQQQQQQGLAMPPPPPPPRSQPAAAAAAGAAPVPAEPAEMHDDDYEFDSEDTDSDYEDAAEQGQAAAAGSGDSDDSDASEDDAYDMVSYLNRMTLQDDGAAAAAGDDDNDSQHSADDNISTAATAGSSVTGSRRPRWGRNGGSSSKPRSAAGGSAAAAARAAGMADDSAAGGSGELDEDSGSGSWETDSEAAEGDDDAEQQQAQGEAPAAAAAAWQGDEGSSEEEQEGSSDESDTAAMDAALTAAEEKDLLGKYQHEEQEEGEAAAAGAGSQRPPKQRRGERKRERWQAQQQAQLLVSLRLEKQGLTDKEARVIASWYASSAGGQRLGFAKLWLFDNSLGDGAAAALAPLIGPSTTEIHLSHNQISAAGAKALLGAVPLQRARGAKPLWLRMEWNQIDEAELRRYIQQDCAARKLVVDIAKELPVEQRTRTDSRGRELNLALAGSGRFGRGLAPEQQTFIVLADTVLKQLDSCKAAEAGVGGPVRRFLDRGLDEAGPKGLDFLTVLAAHEGEGLVVDRQAAVAGSRSPAFAGSSGQRSDMFLARHYSHLQLAKAHGLPAFKLAGAAGFEASLGELIKGGADLSSRQLRQLMAPAATAGLGAVAGRSLQDDFDGAVCCTRGLLDAYQDLSGLLARVSMLVAGAAPGEEPAALQELRQLLQDHQHTAPFESSPSGGGSTPAAAAAAAGGCDSGSSVLEVAQSNIAALERSLEGWEARVRGRHTPSRVLKWASSTGRTPAGPR
ncbi:hypothetical protein OEZ85_012934 [Tetradesmus obliquus]|uniref:Uncharacterized protein n=1 Tax=Tetradesmus obliquus TaxID=3088 RepID=A0ABY8U452_TETOB|nr:hypothetical protein OEZ85_012934 [Tetradesmus obliquus]